MTKKTTLLATFANNETISRTTNLPLAFAWRAWGADSKGRMHESTGFSRRRNLAEKAAAYYTSGLTHNPCGFEVVETRAVDAKEAARALIEAKPFRVFYKWKGRDDSRKPKPVTEKGNQAIRFASAGEAQAFVDRQTAPGGYYHGMATLTIVDDREVKLTKKGKAAGFRIRYRFGAKSWHFVKNGVRAHRRFDTLAEAQTYIDTIMIAPLPNEQREIV